MTTQTTDTVGDRVQLPFTFDALKILEEINKMNLNEFVHYNVLPLRSPAHVVDPSLPFPPPVDDYADGSWTEWLDTVQLKSSPYLLSVIDTFRANTKVNLVRILRLEAGGILHRHTDPTLGIDEERSVIRLTIPVYSNDQVRFSLNDTHVPMQAGECWYMRLTDPHEVINKGTTERINISIDMIPNDWVRSLIIGD
jgi:hypothetical protein